MALTGLAETKITRTGLLAIASCYYVLMVLKRKFRSEYSIAP